MADQNYFSVHSPSSKSIRQGDHFCTHFSLLQVLSPLQRWRLLWQDPLQPSPMASGKLLWQIPTWSCHAAPNSLHPLVHVGKNRNVRRFIAKSRAAIKKVKLFEGPLGIGNLALEAPCSEIIDFQYNFQLKVKLFEGSIKIGNLSLEAP